MALYRIFETATSLNAQGLLCTSNRIVDTDITFDQVKSIIQNIIEDKNDVGKNVLLCVMVKSRSSYEQEVMSIRIKSVGSL